MNEKWTVKRAQRNTVVIESDRLGCGECGAGGWRGIVTHANQEEMLERFADHDMSEDHGEGYTLKDYLTEYPLREGKDYYGEYECVCLDCGESSTAKPIDVTQDEDTIELIESLPSTLKEMSQLKSIVSYWRSVEAYLVEHHHDIFDEMVESLEGEV